MTNWSTSTSSPSQTWAETGGAVNQSYIFDVSDISQTFLTDFGFVPFWQANIDFWENLNRAWES